MIEIKHPYGVTKFGEIITIKGKRFELIEVFPNYGNFNGHSQAKSLASQLKELGNNVRVIAKTNASAVYSRSKEGI